MKTTKLLLATFSLLLLAGDAFAATKLGSQQARFLIANIVLGNNSKASRIFIASKHATTETYEIGRERPPLMCNKESRWNG